MWQGARPAPVSLNRRYPDQAAARACPVGRLEFVGCRGCGFVWNRAFDAERVVYDPQYENDQGYSPYFMRHMEEMARRLFAGLPPNQPLQVLELGCGQGQFLDLLARVAGPRLHSAVGFDPAWRGADGTGPRVPIALYRALFTADTRRHLTAPPNVVVCRHTIEHLPDPVAFLDGLRSLLKQFASPTPILVCLETPCVGWILAEGALHDLFYEHCSLFDAGSLTFALRRAGLRDVRVERVFGGQYLWADTWLKAGGAAEGKPAVAPAGWPGLAARASAYMAHWQAVLSARQQRGAIALWGAGAKGVTFANLVDPEGTRLVCVIDINPAKQGGYLPLSGLPIVSPQEALALGVATALVMNPLYMAEIFQLCRGLAPDLLLVPVA